MGRDTVQAQPLQAPFPYFGGKRRVAGIVWSRFGQVGRYVEPFAGSLAVLLNRPQPFTGAEIVNDLDGFVANFWRAVKWAPEETAKWADYPASGIDYEARQKALAFDAGFLRRLRQDAEYFDPKRAGWWAWGMSCSTNWGFGTRDRTKGDYISRYVATDRQGLNSNAVLDDGVTNLLTRLSRRLRRVVCIHNTDWSGVVCDWNLKLQNQVSVGIFLDPPYDQSIRDSRLYRCEGQVSANVRDWAVQNGQNPKLRIALCGYEGEHTMPPDWECVAWTSSGHNRTAGSTNQNAQKERVWFSPHCLKPTTTRVVADQEQENSDGTQED